MYGKGISRVGEVLDLAVELDVVKKGGSWFSYNDQKLGQGRDNSKDTLLNNPEMMLEIENKIKEKMNAATPSSKKVQKDAKLNEAIIKASTDAEKNTVDTKINADDDFEEFNPAEDI